MTGCTLCVVSGVASIVDTYEASNVTVAATGKSSECVGGDSPRRNILSDAGYEGSNLIGNKATAHKTFIVKRPPPGLTNLTARHRNGRDRPPLPNL